jgi:hypothetical protein
MMKQKAEAPPTENWQMSVSYKKSEFLVPDFCLFAVADDLRESRF